MANSRSTSRWTEELLNNHFQAPEPDPAFLADLRSELAAAGPEEIPSRSRLARNSGQRSWRYALAGALLLILGAVLVIGPGQVWAQLESWIAYLPGWGKVELSGTRVLEEPVSYSEHGVTFEVQEFVASPDETFINILITGFPESVVQDLESEELGNSQFSDPLKVYWVDADGKEIRKFFLGMSTSINYRPCPVEYCRYRQIESVRIKAVSGPIPPEITQVQVDWFPYGIVPGATSTDNWTLTIPLGPISDEYAQNFLQPGYSPQSAEDSQHGVKITVDAVYADASGTVIDAYIEVPESASFSFFPHPWEAILTADTGYRSGLSTFRSDMDMNSGPIYKVTPEVPRATTIAVWPVRWHFDPLGAQPSQMTLEIDSVLLSYDTKDWFEIEIGQDPEVGTIIPLDLNFDVKGFPLHIYQARIVMAPAVVDEVVKDVKAIEFLAGDTISSDGRRLAMISVCSYDQMIIATRSGGSYGCRNDVLPLVPAAIILENGKVRVAIDEVEIVQYGPWVINWDVP